MGLFCSTCQRAFKLTKTYSMHMDTKAHKALQKQHDEDPAAFRKRLSKRFICHFASFISNLQEYTDINVAYQQYLAGNKYRLRGTVYKGLHECAADLGSRAVLKEAGGAYYVKRSMPRIVKRSIMVEELFRGRSALE